MFAYGFVHWKHRTNPFSRTQKPHAPSHTCMLKHAVLTRIDDAKTRCLCEVNLDFAAGWTPQCYQHALSFMFCEASLFPAGNVCKRTCRTYDHKVATQCVRQGQASYKRASICAEITPLFKWMFVIFTNILVSSSNVTFTLMSHRVWSQALVDEHAL